MGDRLALIAAVLEELVTFLDPAGTPRDDSGMHELHERVCQAQRSVPAVRAVVTSAWQVRSVWNDLCRCTDEFLPEYPEACGEYQQALDEAVSALVQHIEAM